jgi:hypothetical protein
MSFVKNCGANPTEVDGFCNNALVVQGHEQMQSQAVIDAEVIESNKRSETENIKTVSAVMNLLSGRKYKLVDDRKYGLCLKYGYVVLYTHVKRGHIKLKDGTINVKNGFEYENSNEGGILTTDFSEKELKFLADFESIINSKASYVSINNDGQIVTYCPEVKTQDEVSGEEIDSPAWPMPA